MSASPDQILAQSYQRLTAGDAAGAERALQPLLMAPRQPAKAMLLLGIIRQAQGRIGEAEAALRSSAESEPRDPQAHYNLGVLLSRQQRHWEAAEAYRNALKAAPRMDEARLALALSLDAVDRQVEAEAEINQCLAHGRTVERLIAYARIMANMQRYALALAAYDEALTLKPGDRNLRFERAGILHKRRRVGEAAAEYEALVATGPASEGLVLAQAAALRDAGRATEADESLDAGIASFPQSVRLHQARSEARLDRGEEDFDGAMTQALSRAPENAALRIALAGLLHRADRREEAEAIFRAGDVRHPGIASSLATLLAQRGALEESAAALARIDLQSAHPRLRKQYAHTLLRLGRAEEAAPLIAAGVAAAPEDQEWVAYHATCARQRGEEEFMRLCDPARFVYVADLPPPPGYGDVTSFNQELARKLDAIHGPYADHTNGLAQARAQVPRPLMDEDDPVIHAFLASAREAARAFAATMPRDGEHPFYKRRRADLSFSSAWTVRLLTNGSHTNHVHERGWISSAYYVRLPSRAEGDPERAGWIKFGEPDEPMPGCEPIHWVEPKVGRLVLFPSYMWHGTEPFPREDRMTVAFDVVPA